MRGEERRGWLACHKVHGQVPHGPVLPAGGACRRPMRDQHTQVPTQAPPELVCLCLLSQLQH